MVTVTKYLINIIQGYIRLFLQKYLFLELGLTYMSNGSTCSGSSSMEMLYIVVSGVGA